MKPVNGNTITLLKAVEVQLKKLGKDLTVERFESSLRVYLTASKKSLPVVTDGPGVRPNSKEGMKSSYVELKLVPQGYGYVLVSITLNMGLGKDWEYRKLLARIVKIEMPEFRVEAPKSPRSVSVIIDNALNMNPDKVPIAKLIVQSIRDMRRIGSRRD